MVFRVVTKRIVFRSLPHGKWVLKGCHKESRFQKVGTKKIVFGGFATLKIIFMGLLHGKCFFRVLPEGKLVLGGCHIENDF